MNWAAAPQKREQMVLIPVLLDLVLPPDHPVRLLDAIFGQLDWSYWEECYHGHLGQPPIHPRVLAGCLIYGLMTRIRSSRALEDAVQMRLDFQWLVEGRTIDHSTFSKFRTKHSQPLKDLFVQVGVLARELGWITLQTVAYDGTRIKANNRRSHTRTPEALAELKQEMERKYDELQAEIQRQDEQEAEKFGLSNNGRNLPQELSDVARRRAEVEAALAELEALKAAGEPSVKHIPLTDPSVRVTPNKEGGFAANYTPLTLVDVANGLITADDVISSTTEELHLVDHLDRMQQDFGMASAPERVLGDGTMGTGPNLKALEDKNSTLYSHLPGIQLTSAENPARRPDLTQPVPQEQWDKLPSRIVKNRKGEKQPQLTKEAFVYDLKQNCFWCPWGKKLSARQQTSESRRTKTKIIRVRYKADAQDCAGCPLRARCMQAGTKERTVHGREVTRDQFDPQRERLIARMETPEAQQIYSRRREVAEHPFATIKQRFGVRQFLLRGLEKVRLEWRWLTTTYNLFRMIALLRARPGPGRWELLSMPPPT